VGRAHGHFHRAPDHRIYFGYSRNADTGATGWQIASNWFFRLVAFAVTYAFFQHFYSGLRHLVMDMGAGFELTSNRMWSKVVFIAAFLTSAAIALLVATRYMGN
jgi:succinate dehydrogenase / fumarate reductase, cytochrome b subunit